MALNPLSSNRTWAALSGMVLLLCSLGAQADAPKGYAFVPYDQGLRAAEHSDRPIFLYFGRYGCGWCDKTNKETFSDAGLKALLEENYELVYVDAESGERLELPNGERITEMELGARLNVFATPVFVFMTPDGTAVMKAPGYQTVADFKLYDRYVREGHYKDHSLAEWLAEQS